MTAPTATRKRPYDADDLQRMPDGHEFELDDGELVRLNMGAASNFISGTIFANLLRFTEQSPVGVPFPAECDLKIFPSRPRRIPKPDGGFTRAEKLRTGYLPEGFIEVVPDMVLEVLSANDSAFAVERKVREYRDAGVSLVWVVYPQARTVHVFRADGTASVVDETSSLPGESAIPEFSIGVATLVAPPLGRRATRL